MGAPKDAPPFIMASYIRGTLQAFEEDRVMIEAQQCLLLAEPEEPIARVAIAADAQLVQMRGLLRKMARDEQKIAPLKQAG